ncbi:hypothetical protein CEXT_461161 [Caerostris extrusa]|uniref:Uncharacterized protein n=1 Tax=Caerostris extrusa TaxID=172846 RepID=A0AAV4SJB9_CAEEX|nr:hypothetical protein CEXT_461161 [Caerostris extrusa]
MNSGKIRIIESGVRFSCLLFQKSRTLSAGSGVCLPFPNLLKVSCAEDFFCSRKKQTRRLLEEGSEARGREEARARERDGVRGALDGQLPLLRNGGGDQSRRSLSHEGRNTRVMVQLLAMARFSNFSFLCQWTLRNPEEVLDNAKEYYRTKAEETDHSTPLN